MNAKEFLKSICRCNETDNINYKPYEHGSLVESIPFKKALEMLEKDICEMAEFLEGFGIFDKKKALQFAFKIWEKHIVKF